MNAGFDFELEVCVTDCPKKMPKLSGAIISDFSEHEHRTHPPVRWMVPAKSKMVIMLDYDIVVCGNISSLLKDEEHLQTVQALDNHLSNKEWSELYSQFGLKPTFNMRTQNGKASPFYPNFGFMVMPKRIFEDISDVFPRVLDKVMKSEEKVIQHFAPQISMSITASMLDIPRRTLPTKYNYPDVWLNEKKDDVLVCHLINSKSVMTNNKHALIFCTENFGSPVAQTIQKIHNIDLITMI